MDFIELCNKSIKANEEILDYTKVFEKKRSNVEEDIKMLKIKKMPSN